jgi:glycosyltransferase involved in cell wall biosynthesis
LINRLGIEDQVQYLGELGEQDKWAAYRQADIFVLPSYSENFGVVVAEALSEGLPVIATKGTPWEDLLRHDCGWWIDSTSDALCASLVEAATSTHGCLLAKGLRARALAERFAWNEIVAKTLQVYRWGLGQGNTPDCVMLD